MPNGSSTSQGPVIFHRKILPPVKRLIDGRRSSGEALFEAEKGNHDSKKNNLSPAKSCAQSSTATIHREYHQQCLTTRPPRKPPPPGTRTQHIHATLAISSRAADKSAVKSLGLPLLSCLIGTTYLLFIACMRTW